MSDAAPVCHSSTGTKPFRKSPSAQAESLDGRASESQSEIEKSSQSTGAPGRNTRSSVSSALVSILSVPPEDDSDIGPRRGSLLYRSIRWASFTVYRRLFTFCFVANAVALIAVGSTHKLNYMNSATAAAINILVALLARQEYVVNALFLSVTTVPTTWPLWTRRILAKIYCYGGWHSGCAISGTIWYMAFTGYATYEYTRSQPALLSIIILAYLVVLLFVLIIVFAHPTMRMKLHNHFEMTHRFAGWSVVALFWVQVFLLAHNSPDSMGIALINIPAFWCLLIVTLLIIYPWTRLRSRTVYFEYLSSHAVRLHFVYTNLDYCVGVRLSTSPLLETHAFATIPNKPEDGRGFSVLISNAGDWTRKTISSAAPVPADAAGDIPPSFPPREAFGSISSESRSPTQPKRGSVNSISSVFSISTLTSSLIPWRNFPFKPDAPSRMTLSATTTSAWLPGKIYTRGVPTYGVLRVADLFQNPIIVTTGSGIGPCLSLLAGRPGVGTHWTCRILWATKAPLKTYGKAVVDDVRRADAWAQIVDTSIVGRPDMLRLAWEMWRESGNGKVPRASDTKGSAAVDLEKQQQSQTVWKGQRSEAVIVISNPKVTRHVVYGLESRGIPAFGVIFDS